MTQMTAPPDKLGAPAKNKPGTWVQTERKAHEGEPAEFGKNRTLRFSGHP